MGQKINPNSHRLPLTRDWQSRWFAERDYATRLLEDLHIREFLKKKFGRQAAVSRIEIKRTMGGQINILIHTAKPGMIIGRAGSGLAELRGAIEKLLKLPAVEVKKTSAPRSKTGNQADTGRLKIDVVEVRAPELSARLVGENIANQIERRIAYRRAMRQAIERVMQAGAKGIRIVMAGRLGGAEIARKEKVTQGSVPLSTLRSDIDYAHVEALTTYGTIGIKVWIHRGQLELDSQEE